MELVFLSNAICGIITLLFNYIVIFTLINFRYSLKKSIIIMASTWLFSSAICFIAYTSGFVINHLRSVSIFVVFFFIVIAITSFVIGKGPFSKKIFAVLFTIDVFLFVISASYVIASGLFKDKSNIITETIVRALLYISIIFIVYKFARPVFIDDEFYHKTTWILFSVVAVMFFGCISYINLKYGTIGSDYSSEPILALVVSILMIITFVAMFYVFTLISDHNKKTKELLLIKNKNTLLNSELDAQESIIFTSKKIRHDVKHHLDIINTYLDENNILEASSYLKEYASKITETTPEYSCNHIINAVFRLYDDKCRRNNINCSLFTNVPEKLDIDDVEMVGLISNLLENAIESCLKVNNASLSFRLNYEENRLFGYMENSTLNSLVLKDGLPVTTKKDGGTGTKIISDIINKHGGVITFEKNDELMIIRFTMNKINNEN